MIAAMGIESGLRIDEFKTDIDYLTGWLVLTIGVQSMPQSERSKLKNYSPFIGVQQRARKSAEALQFLAQVTIPSWRVNSQVTTWLRSLSSGRTRH